MNIIQILCVIGIIFSSSALGKEASPSNNKKRNWLIFLSLVCLIFCIFGLAVMIAEYLARL